jgi:ABC transport system ATP-binding/permease protein
MEIQHKIELPEKKRLLFREKIRIFFTLLSRNFINKLRDKSNLIITFVLPPVLGVFVGGILYYSPGNEYTFFDNKQVATFIFLCVLIAFFLGVTNSVEEIIKEQKILIREKMMGISKISYYYAKFITLIPFAFIQNILFIAVGYYILQGKEFYFVFSLISTLVTLCGIGMGLFISSIPNLSSKAAVNLIPIVLIPQIIFGGALIKYDEMNRSFDLFEKSPIPEICQLMPSRWGFEALITYQGYNNKYKPLADTMQETITSLGRACYELHEKRNIGVEEQLLLAKLISQKEEKEKEFEMFGQKYKNAYWNSSIDAAIDNEANMDYKNYIEGRTKFYPMFIGKKSISFTSVEIQTYLYNCIILLIFIGFFNIITIVVLKIRFT